MENVIFLLKTLSKAFAAHGAQNVLGVLKNNLPSGPLRLLTAPEALRGAVTEGKDHMEE